MNIEEVRIYCLSKPAVTECLPFDEVTLVFKVMDKMFALLTIEDKQVINLKCDPEEAVSLRETYSYVIPGYHMNKKHWNTILLDDMIPNQLLMQWIDNSYNLVVQKLTRKEQEQLKNYEQ